MEKTKLIATCTSD